MSIAIMKALDVQWLPQGWFPDTLSHEGRKLKPAPKNGDTDSYGISYYITIMNHSDWSFLMLLIPKFMG